MTQRIQRLIDFLKRGMWQIRIDSLPPRQALLLRPIRIITLSLRGFDENRGHLRASALTFYTLLSLVPVLAMAFGIAKGFALDERLRELVVSQLAAYPDIAERAIGFADSLLESTRGGVVAGFGVVLLFWAVIKLLDNVEKSLNDIWGVTRGRSFGRRIVDYLAMMVLMPLLFLLSSSVNVFIMGQLQSATEQMVLLEKIGPLLLSILKILPYTALWVLFTVMYRFIPNTRVPMRAAVAGGVFAGTAVVIAQWVYVTFQVGVARYNAIYGSFAAVPLFLAWIQVSWLVIFFGAEIAYAVENEKRYEFERECRDASHRFRRLLALRITQLVGSVFRDGDRAPQALEIASSTQAPLRLVRSLLQELLDAGVLSAVLREGGDEDPGYQPAQSLDRLTIKHVLDALDNSGIDDLPVAEGPETDALVAALASFDALIVDSPGNRLLVPPADTALIPGDGRVSSTATAART